VNYLSYDGDLLDKKEKPKMVYDGCALLTDKPDIATIFSALFIHSLLYKMAFMK